MVTNGMEDSPQTRAFLGGLALIGLPPFFISTSFIYDPTQLFLYAAALYFLAVRQMDRFIAIFILCCLNKETAILLIPVAAVALRNHLPGRRYAALIASLTLCYCAIQISLAAAFRSNPGSTVEFHLLDRNVHMLTRAWKLHELAASAAAAGLLFYRWSEKPRFLKMSLLIIFTPLIILSFFLGYIDEWRGYFEAYPVALALAADTIRRMGLFRFASASAARS
jgi:hypothetical protein